MAVTYQITGKITSFNTDYFLHILYNNLEVRVSDVVFDGDGEPILVLPVNNEGIFSGSVETGALAMIVRLYLIDNTETEFLMAESTIFCRHNQINVEFTIDESKFGDTVFNKILGRLDNVGAGSPATIVELTPTQITTLQALTCINYATLDRLRLSYVLWNQFVGLNPFSLDEEYSEVGIVANNFATEPDNATAAILGRKLFFALLRGTSNGTLNDILTRSRQQFSDALELSIQLNEIEESLLSETSLGYLTASRNAYLFNANDDGRYYEAKIIHLTANSYEDKNILLDDALEIGGLDALNSTETAPDNLPLELAIQIAKLNSHLDNYAPMLKLAVTEGTIGPTPNYHSLASSGVTPWTALMSGGGWVLPQGYSSNGEYANAIWSSIAAGFPTGGAASALANSGLSGYSAIVSALSENADFDIFGQRVSDYFQSEDDEASNYLVEDDINKLEELQRALKYTGESTSMTNTSILINTGYTSGTVIVWDGYDAFLSTVEGEGMSRATANKVWCYAKSVHDAAVSTVVHYKKFDGGESYMPGVLRERELSIPGWALPDDLPDLDTLFGTFNSCHCKDCQSVYSPAAYLADLLNWLRRNDLAYNHTLRGLRALEVIKYINTEPDPPEVDYFERRRDIRYLLLNCANTNTLLPYIDLVNEILSVQLLPDTSGFPSGSPDKENALAEVYKTLQTGKSADEILVEPEHRFRDAEELLTEFQYTWKLPFDMPYEETLSYLCAYGKEYHQLVNDFQDWDDKYNTIQWANAFLKLHPAESDIIINGYGGSYFWKDVYGIKDDTAPTTIKPLLSATNYDYKRLESTISTYFVRETTDTTILPYESDTCDVDQYYTHPAIETSIAERLMQFCRLSRITGLTDTQLDVAINNLSGTLNAATIIGLAQQLFFCNAFKVDFDRLQTVYSRQVYFEVPNAIVFSQYYEKRFLNPLLPPDVIAFFSVSPGASYASDVTTLTNAQKQKLSVVLGISIERLKEILDYRNYASATPLTPTILAEIDCMALVCNILPIPDGQLQLVLDLIVDPFSGGDPLKKLILLNDKLIWLSGLKNDISGLKDLFAGDGKYALATNPTAEESRVWEEIEKGFQNARKANPDLSTVGDAAFFVDELNKELSALFEISSEACESILLNFNPNFYSDFIDSPDGSRVITVDFREVLQLLRRVKTVSGMLGLSAEGLYAGIESELNSNLALPEPGFFWLDPSNTFSDSYFSAFRWVYDTIKLSEDLLVSQEYLFSTIEDFKNSTSSYTTGSVQISSIYDTLGSQSRFKKLTIYEFDNLFVKSKSLVTDDLVELFAHFSTLLDNADTFNIKAASVWDWVWSAPNTPAVVDAAISADVLRAINSNYGNFSTWSDFIVPVKNKLRAKLRDALVALYIGKKGFSDENALYAYYLLDNQMSPCFKISRIVAAVSSVQLIVHRALLGFEPDLRINSIQKPQWEWRKNYRVWEANRKVFLYPENWIDPSLRPSKTPQFKEVEAAIQQDNINDANCEIALAGYLNGLHEVGNLDVRAFLVESPHSQVTYSPYLVHVEQEILHVFARTWVPPYTYYYRRYAQGVWGHWDKMDVEVTGDHLIPAFFNRKLYLFAPVFTNSTYNWEDGNEVMHSFPLVEAQFSFSKFDFGKWSQRKVLPAKLVMGKYASRWWYDDERYTHFKTGIETNENSDNAHGYAVWSNKKPALDPFGSRDYSVATLEKSGFYFYPQLHSNGDLELICRRALHWDIRTEHSGYTEMAYEMGVKISAADERISLHPPALAELSGPRFLTRPYLTLPYYQQMIHGKVKDEHAGAGLWSKVFAVSLGHPATNPSSYQVLRDSPFGNYVLTFPVQYKHSTHALPYFYRDEKNSFFVRNFFGEHKFINFKHPFTELMLQKLNAFGIEGLLNPNNKNNSDNYKRQLKTNPPFFPAYKPVAGRASTDEPIDEFDFSLTGTYSIYNWEVYFHSVSLIARQLRLNNQFAAAIRWLNFVFDPSEVDDDPARQYEDLRYWQIKPFMQDVSDGSIRNFMKLLSTPDNALSQAEKDLKVNFKKQLELWENNPFDPHILASMRPRTYMLWTVMEYITTLTDWGDYLFRQDTMESINEAINLYVIASEILGSRPKKVTRPEPPEKSFDDLFSSLDPFSNALVKIENYLPSLAFCSCNGSNESNPTGEVICLDKPLSITITDLYFCVPGNPKIIEMWDRVDDRLYKIRHCMNIDGKVRQLALFAPPIDPALLVQAVAGGLSIADALADVAAPPPHYRFSYLLQKANEYCAEVKGLGSQLLSLLEKQDAEELALFRQVHEQNILKIARSLKELSVEEAKQNYSTLEASKTLIQIRLDNYKNREYRNDREKRAMELTRKADGYMYAEQGVRLIAGLLNFVPEFDTQVEWGSSGGYPHVVGVSKTRMPFSGSKLNVYANAAASLLSLVSAVHRNMASQALTYAGYDRRQEDWDLQVDMATEELEQVSRQLLAAEIRIATAQKELTNHDVQVAQSKEMFDWMKNKYTNPQLYSWMIGEVKNVYRLSFNLAFNMAKKAQVAMERELGTTSTDIIQFGQWESAKSGLLAGERLSVQLRRLETEYIESNQREYELTKNISLALLDPGALETLKATGSCGIYLPEMLFALDHPGHYFRRIKSVSLSIPCIAGPNTNINASLTLNAHEHRLDNGTTAFSFLSPGTSRLESIATSTSQNDSGLFEVNFKDERYLPFEGAGVISNWSLDLSQIKSGTNHVVRNFDYNTISDVVLHLKYTAREGGQAFADTVSDYIDTELGSVNDMLNLNSNGAQYAFSLRHDMPNLWHEFKQSGSTDFQIEKGRLPYLLQAFSPELTSLTVVATSATNLAGTKLTVSASGVTTSPSGADNVALVLISTQSLPVSTFRASVDLSTPQSLSTVFTLEEGTGFDKDDVDDIIIIAKLGVSW